MKPRLNIATSCDNGYAQYVFINLSNVDSTLSKNYSVHFYLMHSDISSENVKALEEYASSLSLQFHIVLIDNDRFPKSVVSHSKVKNPERFYDGMCHLFLPDDIDRILYIDAGDVLILSEDYPIYFEEFDDKSLIVSSYWSLHDDPWDFDKFQGPWGGFNSGHIVINLKRLRSLNITPKTYEDYVEKWRLHFPDKPYLYGGDQGFLSAFFAGEMKTSGKGTYNTKASTPDGKIPSSNSKAIHFNTMFSGLKPWHIPFHRRPDLDKLYMKLRRKGKDIFFFSEYENDCIFRWWEFCRDTPVFNKLKAESFQNRKFLLSVIKEINC